MAKGMTRPGLPAATWDTGLARPGRPIEHLPAEFSIRAEDIPAMLIHTAEGRSLPAELFGQLAAAFPELERRKGVAVRAAIELLIETGRRPDEICRLPIDCLDTGSAGKAVLVYIDLKQNRLDRRLPITKTTADIIREQQTPGSVSARGRSDPRPRSRCARRWPSAGC